jgi:methionyl-tRNA formyltransferase
MKSVLFLGTAIGYEALQTLIELEAQIAHVFIDSEHAHETERFSQDIIDLCRRNDIQYTLDAKRSDMKHILERCEMTSPVDYIFCFGFRRLIPDDVLKMARGAACSTHFAMLPAYRGFAPVNWAIVNGETQCGVSLFHMAEDADSGPIIMQKAVNIEPDAYIDEVMDLCVYTLKEILKEVWPDFIKGVVASVPQKHEQATYTCARGVEDGQIDWHKSTEQIYNLIRATAHPFPGAYTIFENQFLKIWRARPFDAGTYVGRIPGKVIRIIPNSGIVVLTGDGALLIESVTLVDDVSKSGGLRHMADEYIKSVRVKLG